MCTPVLDARKKALMPEDPKVKFRCRLKLVEKALVASLPLLWGVSFLEEMLAEHLEHAERVFSLCRATSR